MSEIWRLSASRVAALVAQRKLSALEAAESALARLDAVNPHLNAVVDHRRDEVLTRARSIDAAMDRGENPGPLAGVPVTVKINIDQAGFATTNGVTLQKDLVATANSPVVDNLLRAGAVIVGRTNAPAFSYRWFTSNRLHGRTINPRNAELTPGGSFGGHQRSRRASRNSSPQPRRGSDRGRALSRRSLPGRGRSHRGEGYACDASRVRLNSTKTNPGN
jgi:amidase